MAIQQTPKHVRENIARVKVALRRDELVRALNITADSLDIYGSIKVLGPVRFELEVNLDEILEDISHHASIQPILPIDAKGNPFVLRFKRGKEAVLSGFLRKIATMLEQKKVEAVEAERNKKMRRKHELLEKGQAFLDMGDIPRARVCLRRVADEFGKEEGIVLNLAERFRKAKQPMEAAEMYELCIDLFPKEPRGWAGMVEMYKIMNDFEMVEKLYMRFLQQFGGHARTLCTIAKFYLQWRKRDKAAEYAVRALQKDANLVEAQEVLKASESRR